MAFLFSTAHQLGLKLLAGRPLAHRGLALTKRRLTELSPKTRSDLPGQVVLGLLIVERNAHVFKSAQHLHRP